MYNTNDSYQKDLPSNAQLIRSTIIAILVALFILLAFVLPAEYGIDPTGIGNVIGLKEMGRIKVSLQKEFDLANSTGAIKEPVEDKTQVNISGWVDLDSMIDAPTTGGENTIVETANVSAAKTDTIVTTIAPDASAEIKATMKQGETIQYTWSVDQGNLNYNSHGESLAGDEAQYGDGRALESNAGILVAQFDGNHGWFFRNRSGVPVTVTITITGDYSMFKKL